MIPVVEINIPLNSGEVEKWGLSTDDGCVTIFRFIEDKWLPFSGHYIPATIALHMGTVAAKEIALKQSYDVAFQVMYHEQDRQQDAQAPSVNSNSAHN